MADYQEYRRRILHRRWRRVFIIVALLALLALLSAIGILWKVLHRERVDTALSQNTILRQVTTDNTWNTVSYPLARQLRVQTLEDSTETALDFRMAALPASAPVEKSWFAQASFVGDSLTQGLQIYDTGLPGAQFCAYKGGRPQRLCQRHQLQAGGWRDRDPAGRADRAAAQGRLCAAGQQCAGAGHRLHQLSDLLPFDAGYDQSGAAGCKDLCAVHHAGAAGGERAGKPRRAEPRPSVPHQQRVAAIALEKNCYFLNLWEVLADENGDLIESYAQPDGYHIKPEGYAVWVDYLCSHTME